jgi:probable F420-dependent oxidoreductase
MRVGLTIFATDQSIGVVELAREAESRGFHSLFVPEHTHIPIGRRTPAPTGGELPEMYRRCLDPIAALSACAAVTQRLVLGSGISLVAQHEPIGYAKAWATLDHLSGGRTVFGVGFGWNEDEMEHHGVDMHTRRERVREHVAAMTALWTDDEASFDGEFVEFSPSWSWPKPAQRPRPPVLLGGGAGPTLFAHLCEWADGWMPIGGGGLSKALPELERAWSEAGRDGTPLVVPFGVMPSPGKIDHYASLGLHEVVLSLPSAPRDEVLTVLDSYARYVAGDA